MHLVFMALLEMQLVQKRGFNDKKTYQMDFQTVMKRFREVSFRY